MQEPSSSQSLYYIYAQWEKFHNFAIAFFEEEKKIGEKTGVRYGT